MLFHDGTAFLDIATLQCFYDFVMPIDGFRSSFQIMGNGIVPSLVEQGIDDPHQGNEYWVMCGLGKSKVEFFDVECFILVFTP